MPYKTRKYCKEPGCNQYAEQGSAYCAAHKPKLDRERKEHERFYDKQIWKKIRLRQLHDEPLCRICKEAGKYEQATEVDHIIPHKGDWFLFISKGNLQSLCSSCHSSKTRNENGRGV